MVIGIKQRIIEDTDGSSSRNGDQEDEDVMKATAIDIQALAKIVAQCGVAIESFSEFFYKSKFCQRTMLDIGVLRYPDLQQPYIKVECCPLL